MHNTPRTSRFALRSLLAGTILLATAALSSCSEHSQSSSTTILDPAAYNIPYGSDLVWSEALNNVTLALEPFTFSHYSDGTTWTGFVPSRATDTSLTSDWTDRQWTSITGGGIGAAGMPYFAVGYDKSESLTAIPRQPSAMIRMTYSGETFTPSMIWITNTAEGFYVMNNGRPGVPQFGRNDWTKLLITGVRNGEKTNTLTVWLARDSQILGDPNVIVNTLSNGGGWYAIDAEEIGEVDYVYFQMQSSREDYVPTFVIGAFTYSD